MNKIAFTHVPRTGGTWLYRPLSNHLCYDILPHEPVSLHIKEKIDHSHMTMIRHPYDIALSYYHYNNTMNIDIDDYFNNIPDFVKPSTYFDAKRIGEFDVVGTIEFPEATAQLIEQMYNVIVNRDPENELDVDNILIPKMTRQDFELAYPYEIEIYQEGIEKFKFLCKLKKIDI